jgi:hypothetical protein
MPPDDPDPGGTHAAAHERAEQLGDQVVGHGDAIQQLREDVEDLSALVHGAVQVILEDDEEAGPEKTTVVPRQEPPPAGEKPPGEPPVEKSSKHSGLFK